ncbi:hypothetical protein ATEG_05778 [Aspergillus terreus NIH2624]|uniref:cAMP-dependent protein kinase n=1 Tax=Aspergillus terreus (strain NIH 2624 / FGSC A1156) TaxID=341663 RepID=Q0CKK6_ASPTN|nr:uncharacterized protein ATEG_05778 [Aspergillus terreus NIH2624]EAU33539.1 hypothetical protein ATEG_05778 [Aspergillus terreus NIH2624]
MASGTVDPDAPREAPTSSTPSRNVEPGRDDVHRKDKQPAAPSRPSHSRQSNPFVITDHREDRRTPVSNHSLSVQDFALLKTLGTVIKLKQVEHLDYCPGGEIFSYLRRARRFNENTSRFYAAEITLTIETSCWTQKGHIRLVDFGFAKQVGNHETYTLCGTPEYLAPEVIHNSGHGLAVDWWALGILIYEFLVGQPPFWDQNPMRIYEQIVEGHIRFPQSMSPAAQNIISLFCKTNPTERLGYISGGAARVKSHPFFEGINWDDLFYRRVKGPIIPRVDHPADTGNFEDYPDPDPKTQTVYTEDMKKKYETLFSDF